MNQKQEIDIEHPPDIHFILSNDILLKTHRFFLITNYLRALLVKIVLLYYFRNYIEKSIICGYDKIQTYLKRFVDLHGKFATDVQTKPESIKSEVDIKKLRQYCKRYSTEMKILNDILPEIRIGIFQLNQMTFQNEFLPIVQHLLSILETYIPEQSIQMAIDLESNADGILTKLLANPDKTMDRLMHIRYLDECSLEIEQLTNDINYTFECFSLMEECQMCVQNDQRESHHSE